MSKQGLAVFNICLFAFGCTESSLLPSGFLSLGPQRLLFVALQASHCGGFSCCGAEALGEQTSEVAARGLRDGGTWA